MVRSWFQDWHRLPDWDFYGTSRREMEGISHDFNWLSFVPYSEETTLLIPDLGLHPFTGKVRTLGEVLQDPACSPLRPLLAPLQKFLRAQEVFRDDRRQVAMVGGRHGFHVCSWVPVPTRPYSRDGVPIDDFAPPLTGLPWEPRFVPSIFYCMCTMAHVHARRPSCPLAVFWPPCGAQCKIGDKFEKNRNSSAL